MMAGWGLLGDGGQGWDVGQADRASRHLASRETQRRFHPGAVGASELRFFTGRVKFESFVHWFEEEAWFGFGVVYVLSWLLLLLNCHTPFIFLAF